MIKKLFPIVALLACNMIASAQNLTPTQYIEQYKDLAIREMKRMGVPASITLAQGLLETESGNSELLKKSNNHFGIKCKSTWSGGGVSHDDDALGECFRTYKNAEESYRDHSNFLRGNARYAELFTLDPSDYKAWAKGLKKAGYATNPKYPDILIRHIEQYNLQQYSLEAADDVPKFDKSLFEDDKEVSFVYKEDSTIAINEAVESGEDKISYINKIKCVMAPKGTSLLAIATRNNIQLAKLLQYNDMDADGILAKDQPVFLQKKAAMATDAFYVTKKGESLLDVAQQKGIQLESLLEYNNLPKGLAIPQGTRLNLHPVEAVTINYPGKKTEQPTATPAATNPPAGAKIHEVQPKEGLYGISKKYGVTIQQIKEWNHLESDNLSIGQQLIVGK